MIGSATSRDGTPIGYHRLGRGPGVLLLHGSMESAQSHRELAESLADSFTVYLPDRRGRGLSGPYHPHDSIRQDVEDIDALLTQTGAHRVFGVSSGAIILLQAALTLPAIDKAAIFEPPLSVDGPAARAMLNRFDREIAQGNVSAALVTGMKAAQMGPAIFRAMPRWLLERLTQMAMAGEEKHAKPDQVTMRALAPTLHYDFQLALDTALASFSGVRAEVLLLGGSKSPAYLRSALDALQRVLPRARRIEFPGLNHGASGNRDRGGDPGRVAQVLRLFFQESEHVGLTARSP